MRVLLAVTVALFLLAGCDDSEKEATAPASSTELTITVYPEGPDKPGETSTITDAQGLTAKDFEPVPETAACTMIFGGPETATVTGTLDGEPIDAEFSYSNGCEIDRWKTAEPVLGAAPSSP